MIREVRWLVLAEQFDLIDNCMWQAVYGAWCSIFDVVKSDMDRPLSSCVRNCTASCIETVLIRRR
jgi:hypothetical protein